MAFQVYINNYMAFHIVKY